MPGFQVTCKIEGCRDTFNTARYFVRYVNRKHKNMQTANKHFDAFTDIDCDDTVPMQIMMLQHVQVSLYVEI
jgi:hypothetical protein